MPDDAGDSWEKVGTVATEPGDWLDHFISFEKDGTRRIVGGTNKGFILYADVPEWATTEHAVPKRAMQRTRDDFRRCGSPAVASAVS